MHYRASATNPRTTVIMGFPGRAELRSAVGKLTGRGLRAPAGPLERIDEYATAARLAGG